MKATGAQERKGMLLILLCTLLWSISGLMIKQIPWSGPAIAGGRSLIAGCVMALYIRFSGLKFRMDRPALLSGVLLSAVFLTFTIANKLTTAANAIVIQASSPAFVLLYNVLFRKQRARALDIVTVVLTLIGITIFFLDQLSPGRLLGNLIALSSGVLLAAVYIITCGAPKQSCMNGILLAHGLTAVIGIPFALFGHAPFTMDIAGRLLLLGVVQLGIPYVLYGLAVQYCPPLAVSLIGMMEAIFNPLWVFLGTGERPSALALLGGAMVLLTIAFWAVQTQRSQQRLSAQG